MTSIQLTLRAAFDQAISDNPHITDVDAAAVQAGRTIADSIDKITADPAATPTEKTKALYLTPHLISILRDLLATPLARKQVGLAANEGKKASRLAEMQKQAADAAKD